MQVYISFRHMEPSEPLKDYAEEKVKRVLRKYIRDAFDAQITLSVEKFRHIAKFLVSYRGLSIKCEESSDDMYSSIDLALDKLERQVRRYKDKLRERKPAEGREQFFEYSVIAAPKEEEYDEYDDAEEIEGGYEDEVEAAEEVEDAEPSKVDILKREKMSAEPMNVDEALMRIDLEQSDFVVFTNSETGIINVLYRVGDGNFGLIEPQKS